MEGGGAGCRRLGRARSHRRVGPLFGTAARRAEGVAWEPVSARSVSR
jgi:hypothetical protein